MNFINTNITNKSIYNMSDTNTDKKLLNLMSSMSKIDINEILKNSINNKNLMAFSEFVEFNKININEFYVNSFFHNIKNNIPILLTESLIKEFGFKGDIKQQKHSINDLIKKFKYCENEFYWIYSNNEYNEFRKDILDSNVSEPKNHIDVYKKLLLSLQGIDNKLNKLFSEEHVEYNKPEILWGNIPPQDLFKVYPEIIIKHGTGATKQILIMPDLFKDMLMTANTDNGRIVRQYYIQMEKVFTYYIQYQSEFKTISVTNQFDNFKIKSEKQHNKLINKIDEQSNKIDEQSNKIDKLLGFAESTDNRLKIIAPNHVEITRLTYDQCYKCVILKHTKETDIMPYYVIRSQVKSIDEAIKTQQIKYNNRLIVIHTSDQPNPVAFFNIIKSELKDNIKINKNWFSLNDMTDIEFKNKLIDINSRRTKTI